ncbi:hypothetical protein PGTUg99_011089 [Puccinia graminis f. sp. tritici]|uniref:Uncharacterized protein n=1 Tax=Puccinia graminis f. sp. tritici TaxID=56615 RepID=A0A5B0R5I4_PUCGR|nr:hypothetical protein PGTUg99_011089 [Puccinia graminis f. sp. tritici]
MSKTEILAPTYIPSILALGPLTTWIALVSTRIYRRTYYINRPHRPPCCSTTSDSYHPPRYHHNFFSVDPSNFILRTPTAISTSPSITLPR